MAKLNINVCGLSALQGYSQLGVRLISGLKQAYIISHKSVGGQGLDTGLKGVNICSEIT